MPKRRKTVLTEVSLNVTVEIIANERGEAAIQRYVGLPPGNDLCTTPGLTREQVEFDLARRCVLTGLDVDQLDGYADLEPGDILTHIVSIEEGY